MNKYEKLDTITESIINGQRKQALRQLEEFHFDFEDLIIKLQSEEMNEEILRMFRVAINTNYLNYGRMKND